MAPVVTWIAAKIAALTWAKVGSFLLQMVVMTAISYGLSRLLIKGPRLNNGGSPIQLTRDPTTPRRVIYGRIRVSGQLTLAQVNGTKNEFLTLLIAIAAHPIDAFESFFFNDEQISVSGTAVGGRYSGYADLATLDGTQTQASATHVSWAPGVWTTADACQDCPILGVRLKWEQNIYAAGIPNVSSVVRGKKVFDPRNNTTAWSDNPVLCLRDYLTAPRPLGMAIPSGEINDASFIAWANVCDETVDGEKRYTCNGTFDLEATPATIVTSILSSFAGRLYYFNGQFHVSGGAWVAADFDIGESMLRGPITVQYPLSIRERFNTIRGRFASPDEKYQQTEFPPVAISSLVTQDGGELSRSVDFPFTTSAKTAQRLAKIEILRARRGLVASLPCTLQALDCVPGQTVRITNSVFGWTNKTFEVTQVDISNVESANGEKGVGVDLVVQEIDSAVFSWTPGEVPVYTPSVGGVLNIPLPTDITAPAAPTLSTSNFIQVDGTVTPRLRVQWSAATSQNVLSGGKVHVEYKRNDSSDWIVWSAIRGDAIEDYITDVLAGQSYDVRIRFENAWGVTSAYASTTAYTVSADTTPPGLPTSLTATPQTEAIFVQWTPPTDDDLWGVEVFESATNDSNTAYSLGIQAGTGFVRGGLSGGVTRYFWLRAVDNSGNVSALTPSRYAGVGASAINGGPLISVALTNEAHTVPADSAGNVTSFAGAVTTIKIYNGITDDTANWPSISVTGGADLSVTQTGTTFTATALYADSGYIDITAARPGYPTQVKRFVVTKSKTGSAGANAKLVVLTSDAQTFQYPKAGGVNPSGITFTATGQNLTGSPTFTVTAGTATLTGSGTTRSLAPADMTSEAITVRVQWDGVEDYLSVVKVREGADGANGSNAPQLQIQYSVDGSSGWTGTYDSSHVYMRTSNDGGSTWSAAVRIKGETGAAGGTNKVATPAISFDPASFSSSSATSDCTITCSTSGATIWYQKGSDTPRVYTGSFSVNHLTAVASWAEKSDMVQSDTAYDMYENNT